MPGILTRELSTNTNHCCGSLKEFELEFEKRIQIQIILVTSFIPEKPTKDDIDWQQSSVEAEHVIARLTRANGKDIVFDPMMGSGTTGTAAYKAESKIYRDR